MLCSLCGIETSYRDARGRVQRPSAEALMGVLRAWGVPVRSMSDVPRALEERRRPAARRVKGPRVIRAPRRCYEPPGGRKKEWGLFLPLHALRCGHGWGAGDYSDLADLLRWTAGQGGDLVGALPLLPVFLDRPFDPSPYSPVSRLLWGEFWVDPARAPEMEACAKARALAASPAFTRGMERLRRGDWVDYPTQMELKRRLLEELARFTFTRAPARRLELERFLRSHPEVEPYARFRAAREKSPAAVRYYLYAQWLAHAQIKQIRAVSRRSGARLYLDLPLGVHPAGYDAWRYSEVFASGASVGAPPDSFFTRGQDWGFRPLHPERERETGYRYSIASIRHQMSAAGALRIDHVMGFHRLFWIPQGFPANQGTYVRYHPEEMYAVLARESRRNRCAVVGEDLGIVPQEVRAAMSKHGLRRMFVVQFEMAPGSLRLARRPPRGCLAALNTHDMPPFAAFWKGPRPAQALRRFLRLLASGPARTLLVNLEDLWGEKRPQNVPGTYRERPNWRRKARYGLAEFRRMPAVLETLKEITRLRGLQSRLDKG